MPTSQKIAFVARCGVWLLLGIPVPRAAQAEHLNILMIGNSYTQGNATARATSLDLQGLFDADPVFSASVTVRADSSASLQGHAGNSVTTGLITSAANVWDVIILQERSERPALAMKYGGSELTGLDKGGPVLISNYIKPFQPQASVVLFNTWARALGNQDLVNDFNNDPAQMLSYTNQGYDRIRQKLPGWDHSDVTTIARVGDAWDDWYQTYGYAGSNGLHLSDGTHQNNRGAYLAAAVLFETITGRSTVGNSYVGAVTGSITGTSQVLLLQQQATAVTGATVALPGDYNDDHIVDAADYTVWRKNLGGVASLPNDDTAGVGLDDYDRWRHNFGNSSISGSGSFSFGSVPEPSSASHLLLAFLALACHACFRTNEQAARQRANLKLCLKKC